MEEQCERGITEIAEGPSICTPAEDDARGRPAAVQEVTAFGAKVWLDRPLGETLDEVRRALHAQGFQIAFEMDAGAVLRADPGVKFPGYHIIGAWYPSYAREALEAEMDAGLLMPHNIVVFERSGGTVVAAVDPITQFNLIGGGELHDLAVLVRQRLQDVLDRVTGGGAERAA